MFRKDIQRFELQKIRLGDVWVKAEQRFNNEQKARTYAIGLMKQGMHVAVFGEAMPNEYKPDFIEYYIWYSTTKSTDPIDEHQHRARFFNYIGIHYSKIT